MRGLELARGSYDAWSPVFCSGLPYAVEHRLAFGLAGAGSECLGFDDDISHDHDFGPGFCVWVPHDLFETWGPELQSRYAALPDEFMGYRRQESELAGQRVGVFDADAFVASFCGTSGVPQSMYEWLQIPEQFLACVTDGEIWRDGSQEFTKLREDLAFYPEPIIRKKLAADMSVMAQAGQYNLKRCLERHDMVAANAARAEFLQAAMAGLHLLAHRYMPFYKWSYRSLCERTGVPRALTDLVGRIAEAPVAEVSLDDVEAVSVAVLRVTEALGWCSRTGSDFLLDAAVEIWQGIPNDYLRSRPLREGAYRP